jgi:hypothetical protein
MINEPQRNKLGNFNTIADCFISSLAFLLHTFSKFLGGGGDILSALYFKWGLTTTLALRLHCLYLILLALKEVSGWNVSTQRSTGVLPWLDHSPRPNTSHFNSCNTAVDHTVHTFVIPNKKYQKTYKCFFS